MPHGVYNAQHGITLRHGLDDDAEAVHVVDLLEPDALAFHLAEDGVDVLRTPVDLGLDAGFGQSPFQLHLGLDNQLVAVAFLLLDGVLDFLVAGRVEIAEAQVFQLRLDTPDTQPVGQRRIVVERLAGDAPALVFLLTAQRAHVVQAVGELDDQHAQILDAGQHHFAQRFSFLVADRHVGLAFLLLDLLELGHTVDQLGDGGAELDANVIDAKFRILGDIVQQTGSQRLRVHAQLGQYFGDGDRVRDVGFAAVAQCVAVRVAGQHVGAQQQVAVLGLEAVGQMLPELVHGLSLFGRWIDPNMFLAVSRWQRLESGQRRPWDACADRCCRRRIGRAGRRLTVGRSSLYRRGNILAGVDAAVDVRITRLCGRLCRLALCRVALRWCRAFSLAPPPGRLRREWHTGKQNRLLPSCDRISCPGLPGSCRKCICHYTCRLDTTATPKML